MNYVQECAKVFAKILPAQFSLVTLLRDLYRRRPTFDFDGGFKVELS